MWQYGSMVSFTFIWAETHRNNATQMKNKNKQKYAVLRPLILKI